MSRSSAATPGISAVITAPSGPVQMLIGGNSDVVGGSQVVHHAIHILLHESHLPEWIERAPRISWIGEHLPTPFTDVEGIVATLRQIGTDDRQLFRDLAAPGHYQRGPPIGLDGVAAQGLTERGNCPRVQTGPRRCLTLEVPGPAPIVASPALAANKIAPRGIP
jgi:hypothetical protein